MVMPIVSVDQEFGDGKVQLISILGVWVTFGRLEGEGARPKYLSGHSLISLTTNVGWWLRTSVLATWASWASTQHGG